MMNKISELQRGFSFINTEFESSAFQFQCPIFTSSDTEAAVSIESDCCPIKTIKLNLFYLWQMSINYVTVFIGSKYYKLANYFSVIYFRYLMGMHSFGLVETNMYKDAEKIAAKVTLFSLL